MKAVGYFVEGAQRDGQRRSIGEQNRAFLDFCSRFGFDVAATFLDTDNPDAEGSGFRQMLKFLSRDDRGFMVVAIDGLGVLGGDLGQAAMKLLTIEATGVQVVSVHTGKELARELVTSWAERGGSEPVSERVRSAMRRKAVRGEALGRPPYGYRVGPRRKLELVPEEAVVVRYIFRLYLHDGLGIRKIAGKLNEENIPTRKGGRWSMVSVRDLLRNRAYLGTYTRFGVKIPGSHPPLVSPEDFRRVQERLQSRQSEVRERKVTPFLLSGIVYCARCGNRMIGVSRRQKWKTKDGEQRSASYRYYQCESRTNQSACGYNTQREQELEARVRELLAEDSEGPRRVRRAGNIDSYLADLGKEIDRIEGRMRKVKRQVEELVADAAEGLISIERMKSLGKELVQEQQELEAELAATKARLSAHESEAERHRHLRALRQRLVTEWDQLNFEDRQAFLREVVDRIEVDGPDVRLYLRP